MFFLAVFVDVDIMLPTILVLTFVASQVGVVSANLKQVAEGKEPSKKVIQPLSHIFVFS